MCIWLLYKILAPLSKNEQINRSKEFVAHLKAGGIEPPKWKALLGNRDLARTFNAGAVVSFFTSAAFGCLHCSTCLEKHPVLQHVLAPQPAGAIAPADTSKYCAACFLGCTRNANDTRRVACVRYRARRGAEASSWPCVHRWRQGPCSGPFQPVKRRGGG